MSAACAPRSTKVTRHNSSTPFAVRVTASVRLRSLFSTSSFRLALIYAAVTGISFALLFTVIFWSTSRFMRHQIDDSVANELNEIMSEAPGDTAATRAIVAGLARESSGFAYLFQDPQGNVLAGNIRAL